MWILNIKCYQLTKDWRDLGLLRAIQQVKPIEKKLIQIKIRDIN